MIRIVTIVEGSLDTTCEFSTSEAVDAFQAGVRYGRRLGNGCSYTNIRSDQDPEALIAELLDEESIDAEEADTIRKELGLK